jgi:hypothetical protein
MTNKTNRVEAQQTFRQFAWNLAGTLSKAKPAQPRPAKR